MPNSKKVSEKIATVNNTNRKSNEAKENKSPKKNTSHKKIKSITIAKETRSLFQGRHNRSNSKYPAKKTAKTQTVEISLGLNEKAWPRKRANKIFVRIVNATGKARDKTFVKKLPRTRS